MALPRRARVDFTVPGRFPAVPFFDSLSRSAGRYVAFYFPSAEWGWADVTDPGSVGGWSAQLDFGSGHPFPLLQPGHRYTMFVALDRAARVRMPFPMSVVAVHPASFQAAIVVQPVSLLTHPAAVALGSTADQLGARQLTSTAIVLDWKNNSTPFVHADGHACPAATEAGALVCGQGNMSYTGWTYETGSSANPVQLVLGEAFDKPTDAAVVAGYADTAPTPFDAATLLGFAVDPPKV